MTHTTRISGVFDVDNALDPLQCFSNGPMHTTSIFQCKFTDVEILLLYYPFNHLIFCAILCCNWLKLLYASPFAWFSTSLASSSIHLTISFIKLPRIEDKHQQHCFSIEGKSIIGIGCTLSIKVISSLVNLAFFIKIWESIQTGFILLQDEYWAIQLHSYSNSAFNLQTKH